MNTKSNKKSVIHWIILFLVFAGFAGCIGLTRWAKNSAPELEQVISEAQEYGSQADENACLEKTFTTLDECGSFRCSLMASVFFAACLPASTPSESFCDYAPQDSGLKKQAEWSVARCRQLKRDDKICVQLMTHVSDHCNSESRQSKIFKSTIRLEN